MLTHFDQHPDVVTQEVNANQGDASHLIKQKIRLMIYICIYISSVYIRIYKQKYNKMIANMKYLFEN